MKKEHSYLIASIAFFIAAIAFFLSEMDNKVMLGSVFVTLGAAFTAIFTNQINKGKR